MSPVSSRWLLVFIGVGHTPLDALLRGLLDQALLLPIDGIIVFSDALVFHELLCAPENRHINVFIIVLKL